MLISMVTKQISIRVTNDVWNAWDVEAKKRDTDISKFIRDCVFRVLGECQVNEQMDDTEEDSETETELQALPVDAERDDLKRRVEELEAIIHSQLQEINLGNIRAGLHADECKIVLVHLQHEYPGELLTLDQISTNVNLPLNEVYTCVQMLIARDLVHMSVKRHPTKYWATTFDKKDHYTELVNLHEQELNGENIGDE